MNNFQESDIIFVADMFLEDYGGGAERTTEALFETAIYKTVKIKSNEITQELIQQSTNKFWVFFNYRSMDHNLIPVIVANCRYAIVEYDYKFCQYRSIDLHKRETDKNCDCHDTQLGKIISAFLHGSEHIFWMSKKQSEIYHERFPFLKDNKQTVLSSIFAVEDLEYIERLRIARKENGWSKNHWGVIDGNSWIKGVAQSCESVRSTFPESTVEILGGLSYYDLLKKLSGFEGLSFQPLGGDTCPRTVIEASLLGLELLINNNVQCLGEEWFSGDSDEIESYLLSRPQVFWDTITEFIERDVFLSGYTTTKDVIKHDYPWEASITSLLGFCDEVVIVDGGSTDGTWEKLEEWSRKESKLKIYQVKRDWEDKKFALFDFQQKAIARNECTGDWCWQMDIDEVVHEKDFEKIKTLIRQVPKSSKVICLPVIDFWGKKDKIRLDVHPWKWRLSKNSPEITHDIPAEHRRYDEEGNVYSIGSDGCDYVNFSNYQLIPHVNFYTPQHEEIRKKILNNQENQTELVKSYKLFIETAVNQLPSVYHYSWFDIKRKIYNYRDFWSKFHASLYNQEVKDTAENNKIFSKPWSEVTEKEITDVAEILEEDFGGWIFHKHLNLEEKTPWYKLKDPHPKFIKSWIEERK